MNESYIGGANPFMPLTAIDTLTINIPLELITSEKYLLDYLLKFSLHPYRQYSDDVKHESIFYLSKDNKRAKVKLIRFYAHKQVKLVFFGLSQYSNKGKPLKALKNALRITKSLLRDAKLLDSGHLKIDGSYIGGENPLKLSIAHVDVCYDLSNEQPISHIPLEAIETYSKNYYNSAEAILYQSDEVLTGIKIGSKDTRFKFTIYDKEYKENDKQPIVRIEKRFREKNLKPVTITSMADIFSYLRQLRYEFAEELVELENLFNSYATPRYKVFSLLKQ